MDLLQDFQKALISSRLIRRGDSVLMAVSGGVDSAVMVDLFMRIRDSWGLSLAVAHVHHGLRGRAADRDETFVRDLAVRSGLRFYSVWADVPGVARRQHVSDEMAGRDIRFQSFERWMDRAGYNRTALGHQADDQAETILFHLLRGTGIRGLRGIPSRRGRFIHPMLTFTRGALEAYALSRSIQHVEDASNRSRHYTRNRLRRDILPRLEAAVGASVIQTICRTGSAMEELEAFVVETAQRAAKRVLRATPDGEILLDIDPFLRYFIAIRKAILIQVLEGFSASSGSVDHHVLERVHLLSVSGRSGSTVSCGQGVTAVRSGKTLVFHRTRELIHSGIVTMNGMTRLDPHRVLRADRFPRSEQRIEFSGDGRREFLDYDSLPGPLSVRTPRPGDRFIPLGMCQKKKLHDFFIDEGVPNYRRAEVPLLVSGDEIIWIMGYRIDERYRITDGTKVVLRVEITMNGS